MALLCPLGSFKVRACGAHQSRYLVLVTPGKVLPDRVCFMTHCACLHKVAPIAGVELRVNVHLWKPLVGIFDIRYRM